jgi:hypothetical protein
VDRELSAFSDDAKDAKFDAAVAWLLVGCIETTPKTLPVGLLLVLAPVVFRTNFATFYESGPSQTIISLDGKYMSRKIILNIQSSLFTNLSLFINHITF